MEILNTTIADWNVVVIERYKVTNEINSEFCSQPIRVGQTLNQTISSFGVLIGDLDCSKFYL